MDCGIFYSQERINKLRTNTRISGTDASSQASTSNRKEDDKREKPLQCWKSVMSRQWLNTIH